jgi:5'-nucleotidase
VGEPIARRLPDGLLGNLVADAQRVIGEGDVAIMNTGGVRVDLRPGVVTRGDVFEVQPFGNRLVRWHVSGAWLLTQVERAVSNGRVHLSGVVVEIDTTRALGSRLLSAKLSDGRRIDPAARYRLVLTDFLAEGNDRLISDGPEREEVLPMLDREALERYLQRARQPVMAPRDVRIIYRR